MKFTTVIFDLDGTLLNTLDDLTDCGNHICRLHGWPEHTTREYRYFVGNGIPKLVERFSPPEARTPEALARTLPEYSAYYDLHKADKTAPYPGVAALLARLRAAGVVVGVFTNKDDAPAQGVLAHYLPGLFDKVQGRVEGVAPKPDPTGLFRLMEALHADPARTLFVGDSDVDILTGHNGHLPACGVLWGFRTEEELMAAGADYLAADADALAKLILEETE